MVLKEIHQQITASGELGHTAETKVGAGWVKSEKGTKQICNQFLRKKCDSGQCHLFVLMSTY